MTLKGKIALVTGASRGIGRATALRLAKDGAYVWVHYKQQAGAAQEVLDAIRKGGGDGALLQADISSPGQLEEALRPIQELDILVNNAGWASFAPLAQVSPQEFEQQFALNVQGLFVLTQLCAGRLRDNGRIVNVSSGITRVNAAGASVYAATKAAVEAFTRSWAAELGPRGITVNTVSPGMTETDLLLDVTPQEVLDSMAKQTPLGRLGQPEDIADVIAFLCGESSRWVTANNILANGGVG